jgi:hypothetical protein
MNSFFNDYDFSKLMTLHIKDIVEMLLQKGESFSILTNIEDIEFDPILPDEIIDSFKPITLFVVSDYTFESCEIDEDNLYFEAGFGHQNVGSTLTIPLGSIVQILIENTPLFINLSRKLDSTRKKENIQKSTNIFLSNPENKNLIN